MGQEDSSFHFRPHPLEHVTDAVCTRPHRVGRCSCLPRVGVAALLLCVAVHRETVAVAALSGVRHRRGPPSYASLSGKGDVMRPTRKRK